MVKSWFRRPYFWVQFFIILIVACFYLFTNLSIFTDYSKVKVRQIIDGDTIILANGKHLRYLGMDTPETHLKEGDKWIFAPQPFGNEAAEFNRQLVEGKTIRVEFDTQKYDKYNRLLGYCFLPDGRMVNIKMLEEGLATLFIKAPNVKYTDLMISAQNRARENKKNLWGDYEIISAAEAKGHINQIRTIRGKVEKTYDSGAIILLSLGKNYNTAFTIGIFDDARQFFYIKNINPAVFYTGKTIEISGRIRQFKGRPEMIVSIPEEITILNNSIESDDTQAVKSKIKKFKRQKNN